jgi:hypothetical protein
MPTPTNDTEVVAPKPLAVAATEQEAVRQSLIDKMRDYFKDQKRVRVKVRNDSDVPVQINGYTFIVQHDVPVDVPQDVADLLEAADYI